mmetsp:Transcript_65921/g.169649  ORF Transcript_65921/g.169649 Transcript_65921/m.169649 type:complete len:424 (+) Transcript_65921:2857-4128(+)
MRAIKNSVLHALVRGVRCLGMDALHHAVRHPLHGREEDVAAQLGHQEPAVGDVGEIPLRQDADAHAVRRHLRAAERPAEHRRDGGVLPDEGYACQEQAHSHCVEQLAGEDEDAHDHQNLDPLLEPQVLPGAPEILADEACAGEEQQGAQEEPREVVDEVRRPEEADSAEQRVDGAGPAVGHVAEDAVVDDVELQLHVPHRLAQERREDVAGAEELELVVFVDLHGQLHLRGGDFEHAIEDDDHHHEEKVRQRRLPRVDVDLVVLEEAIHPRTVPVGVLHHREEPLGLAGAVDAHARPEDDRVEDAERQEQSQRHHDGGTSDVVGLQEVEGHADGGRRDELEQVVVAKLEGVLEHLVADAREEGLLHAHGHEAHVPRQLEPAQEPEDCREHCCADGRSEDGRGAELRVELVAGRAVVAAECSAV